MLPDLLFCRMRYAGLVFVEAVMDRDDAPIALIHTGYAIADADYGPRGP